MSIIRSPLFQLALVFVSFNTLSDLAHARLHPFSVQGSPLHQEDVELQSRIAREWNDRISPEFWELAAQTRSNPIDTQAPVSLQALNQYFSELQFKHDVQCMAAIEEKMRIAGQSVAWSELGSHPLFAKQGESQSSAQTPQHMILPDVVATGPNPFQSIGVDPFVQQGVDAIKQEHQNFLSEGVQEDSADHKMVFVEAFDRYTSRLEGVETQFLSSEPVGDDSRGWLFAASSNHWPTVSWVDPQSRQGQIPLLGRNTIALLESRFGIRSEATAGIIFGRIKAGWKVELSDRAERPIFIDDLGIPSEQSNDAVDRNFIFMNSAPGVQMVFVESIQGRGNGSVAVPVLTGAASYVDLTHIQFSTLSGHVAERTEDPSSMTTLRVVGQSAAVTGFHVGERFQIDQVVVVHPYPVFIETDRGDGFTQRYRLLSDQLKDLALTRFSRERIEKWRRQISSFQDGISSDSGMLVAAFPGLVERYYQETDLQVRIRPIPESSQLSPTLYVRAPNGALHFEQFIAPHEDFIVGAQIPEGPFILEVVNHDQRVLYSELSFSSPGVLNIFNPK